MGQGFSFTKSNVLKVGLMITDRADSRFQVKAITSENVAALGARVATLPAATGHLMNDPG